MLRQVLAVSLILSSIAPLAMADDNDEIDHLLNFLGKSECSFVRNGKTYDAEAARAHIEGKYDYVKRWIRTTEQFIEYAATQSSLSGEPYQVVCSGHKESSADWLKRELARLRATSPPKGGPESPQRNREKTPLPD